MWVNNLMYHNTTYTGRYSLEAIQAFAFETVRFFPEHKMPSHEVWPSTTALSHEW